LRLDFKAKAFFALGKKGNLMEFSALIYEKGIAHFLFDSKWKNAVLQLQLFNGFK